MYNVEERRFISYESNETKQKSIFYKSNIPIVGKKRYVIYWTGQYTLQNHRGEYEYPGSNSFFFEFDRRRDRRTGRKILRKLNKMIRQKSLPRLFCYPIRKTFFERPDLGYETKYKMHPVSLITYSPEKNLFFMTFATKDDRKRSFATLTYTEEGILKKAVLRVDNKLGKSEVVFKDYKDGFAIYQARYAARIYYNKNREN